MLQTGHTPAAAARLNLQVRVAAPVVGTQSALPQVTLTYHHRLAVPLQLYTLVHRSRDGLRRAKEVERVLRRVEMYQAVGPSLRFMTLPSGRKVGPAPQSLRASASVKCTSPVRFVVRPLQAVRRAFGNEDYFEATSAHARGRCGAEWAPPLSVGGETSRLEGVYHRPQLLARFGSSGITDRLFMLANATLSFGSAVLSTVDFVTDLIVAAELFAADDHWWFAISVFIMVVTISLSVFILMRERRCVGLTCVKEPNHVSHSAAPTRLCSLFSYFTALCQLVSLGSLYSFMQLLCYPSERIYVDIVNPSPLLGA